MMKTRMEDNREIVENIMEEITGKRRGLECSVSTQPDDSQEKGSPEKTAILIKKEFKGLDIEIEED